MSALLSMRQKLPCLMKSQAVQFVLRETTDRLALRAHEGLHMASLNIQNVSKSFEGVYAVNSLNIDAASGELVVLLGLSGAGRTITLRLVAGLETPDSGAVHIGGRDVTRSAPAMRDVTFVFQQYSLFPHLNVFDNLVFPLRSSLRKVSEAEIKLRVHEVPRMLRMEDKLKNPATKLSGGQMQRVAIGRALVRNPAVYLMDEPLSSLDAKLRNDLRLEIKRIQNNTGATMLYVTHDQVEALTLASCIGVLDQRNLVQLRTPTEVYKNPVSVAVASRLGSTRINLLPRSLLSTINTPSAVKLFWQVLEEIAARDCMTVTQLATKLHDEVCDAHGNIENFASFLRVSCLRYVSLQIAGGIPADRPVSIQSLNADAVLALDSHSPSHSTTS
jgi:multiple sugar transport system ATP-binding protein